jgi:biotin carboxyl carrier protein
VVEPLGFGRFAIESEHSSQSTPDARTVDVAYAVRDNQRVWVFLNGRTYIVEAERQDTSEVPRVADDQVALSAPMPATVIAVQVAAGQQVAAGDRLVLLEAMKMEVPIVAPRSARVKSIACREGELVQPGVPLLELE